MAGAGGLGDPGAFAAGGHTDLKAVFPGRAPGQIANTLWVDAILEGVDYSRQVWGAAVGVTRDVEDQAVAAFEDGDEAALRGLVREVEDAAGELTEVAVGELEIAERVTRAAILSPRHVMSAMRPSRPSRAWKRSRT